jgi:lysozyme
MKAGQVVVRFGVPLVLASAGYLGFVNKWEADKAQATKVYADRLARGEPTVCDGITNAVSPYPVVVGDIWSEQRCQEVNALVAVKTQIRLLDCFKVPVQQNTFDALSSHAHNVGVGNTCASKAVGLINSGRLAEGCRALAYTPEGDANWSYVTEGGKKKFVQGLHNRRKEEAALCVKS